jgi:hypothetical protein
MLLNSERNSSPQNKISAAIFYELVVVRILPENKLSNWPTITILVKFA